MSTKDNNMNSNRDYCIDYYKFKCEHCKAVFNCPPGDCIKSASRFNWEAETRIFVSANCPNCNEKCVTRVT